MNAVRGEVALTLGGRRYRLCLTLGALAQIESALGAEDLAALSRRLTAPRAGDLLAVLEALLRGGGETLNQDEIAALPFEAEPVARAIAAAFSAAGFGES